MLTATCLSYGSLCDFLFFSTDLSHPLANFEARWIKWHRFTYRCDIFIYRKNRTHSSRKMKKIIITITWAVLTPGNRAKPCKFRYVKSVRNFMWKLCYRKDGRAMRPIRGRPEKFRDSLTTPTATIPKNVHGLLFRSTLWTFLQSLKSVALPVPEIIGGTKKWVVPGYAHAPFSAKF